MWRLQLEILYSANSNDRDPLVTWKTIHLLRGLNSDNGGRQNVHFWHLGEQYLEAALSITGWNLFRIDISKGKRHEIDQFLLFWPKSRCQVIFPHYAPLGEKKYSHSRVQGLTQPYKENVINFCDVRVWCSARSVLNPPSCYRQERDSCHHRMYRVIDSCFAQSWTHRLHNLIGDRDRTLGAVTTGV